MSGNEEDKRSTERRSYEFADPEENNLEFRHVKIGSNPGTPSLLKLPSLPQAKLPGPPKGLLRPPRLTEHQTSLTVKKEWTANVATASWEVCPEELDLVPLDFPLERTHREIRGSDACKVATRISSALQKLSIQADYNKDEAKCQTADFVTFHIRLFAGGEGCQPVVVELQRRNGPAMTFMQSCRAILNAAEGVPMDTRKKKCMPPFNKPIGEMKCLQGLSLSPKDPVKEADGSVVKAIELLKEEKSDLNVLGMEKLCHLTDPMKCSRTTSTHVAKMIILGVNKDIKVRCEMYSCLSRAGEDDEDTEGFMDLARQLRHHALRVFDNCLQLISVKDAVKEQPWIKETLIPMLLRVVQNAKSNPHCAYVATCCLSNLVSSCEHGRESVQQYDGAIDALQQASIVGREYHDLLASETNRCLERLL
mmetsp:Transcript_8771/g.12748  ORF Transcript_8771/g.12748 Transcript_8771/m.12748 type:complete len:422 (+) Transcript_8771:258-1523(+)